MSGFAAFAITSRVFKDLLESVIILGGGLAIALVAHRLVFGLARRLAARTATDIDSMLVQNIRAPARWALMALVLQFLLPITPIRESSLGHLRHGLSILLIASVTWLIIRAIGVIDDVIKKRHPLTVRDNLRARQIHTQSRVLSRTLMTIVGVLGTAAILMTFPRVREFGTSLLASAGVAGIILGFASRATLSNLIAGVQLALTQPIRIDDVVIVAGEWGWIEEIRSTFVVVRIWDDRRLVVPLQHFIEQPFQNWTRRTSHLLGTVFFHADYRLPVQQVREELKKIVADCEEWDGRVCVLQVTEAKDQTIELRALVSAPDSPKAWDLRCKVREKLIGYLQSEFPDCLPRVRAEIERGEKVAPAEYSPRDDIDAKDVSLEGPKGPAEAVGAV